MPHNALNQLKNQLPNLAQEQSLLSPLIHELEKTGDTANLAIARLLEATEKSQQHSLFLQQQNRELNEEIIELKEKFNEDLVTFRHQQSEILIQVKHTNGRVTGLEQREARIKWGLGVVGGVVVFFCTLFATKIADNASWIFGGGAAKMSEMDRKMSDITKTLQDIQDKLNSKKI